MIFPQSIRQGVTGSRDQRGLDFRLDAGILCECMIFPQSIRQGDTGGVIKTAEVELDSGRV
jgi:hypothetical protein